jgi:hypothetical protein
MILITTSRKPGRKTRTFSRDLQRALPDSVYINRGKGSIEDVVELALARGYTRILIVGETKGNPSIIRTLELDGRPRWGIEIYITPIKLCRELPCTENEGDYIKVESESYEDVLKKVFGYPIEEGEPVILQEDKSIVEFLYEGQPVGPVFRIRGWNRIPDTLKRQSGVG